MWFRFDSTALMDDKLIVLRKRFGFEGVGIYIALVMLCYECDGSIPEYKLPIFFEANDFPNWKPIFEAMLDLRLFTARTSPGEQTKTYHSGRVTKELAIMEEARNKYVEAGRKGGQVVAERFKKAKKPSDAKALPEHRQSIPKHQPDHTVPTIPNQAVPEKKTDTKTSTPELPDNSNERTPKRERKSDEVIEQEFFDLVKERTWLDEAGIAVKRKQLHDLRTENRDECFRKMRVALNSARGSGEHLGQMVKTLYVEIVGKIQDEFLNEKTLDGKEAAKRREFATEENGAHYAQQESGGAAPPVQEWE